MSEMESGTKKTRWLRLLSVCFVVTVLLSVILLGFGYSVSSLPNDSKTIFMLYSIGLFALVMLAYVAITRRMDNQVRGVMLPIIIWLLVLVAMSFLRGWYVIFLTIASLILPALSAYFAFSERKKRPQDK